MSRTRCRRGLLGEAARAIGQVIHRRDIALSMLGPVHSAHGAVAFHGGCCVNRLVVRRGEDDGVVSRGFLGCDRGQAFLLPPRLDEWLPEDHFARFVIAAVEALDLSAFYADYRADGHGRPAHDPAMMVALLMYAYARGQRSSRVIERGCFAKPYTPPQQPTGRINVTDPDSRTLKTPRGFLQGYNAQAVCNEQQIIVAAEVSVSSADFGQMGPMIEKARAELAAAGVADAPEVVLADADYWHGEQIDKLMGQGVQVLIPPDADKRRGTRPGWDGGRYAFMHSALETAAGQQLYAQRQRMIEPVFADTKFNRRADRFLRRGRAAARSEWRLITATGNLLKLWRHTTAPAPA